jgi:1-acyl-sn-glycerol-3-phosphate acyltransferase
MLEPFLRLVCAVLTGFLLLLSVIVHSVTIALCRGLFLLSGQAKGLFSIYAFSTEWLYASWVAGNAWCVQHILGLQINIHTPESMPRSTSYLMTANHQCYADILLLQLLCHRRLPTSKFFLKDALLYLPFVGLGCWGLNFVFVKRFSRRQLKKNPARITALNARIEQQCIGFQRRFLTLINFAEGTRFSPQKHQIQHSTYQHLLPPQAVGLATMIRCLYPHAQTLLAVTIDYGCDHPSFIALLMGQIKTVHLHVQTHPLTPDLVGHYANDKGFRQHFRKWLNHIWQQKDTILSKSRRQHSTT